MKKISRIKALELIKGTKGKFFTATFIKKDSTERRINAQYIKDQDESTSLGYVKVKETVKMRDTPKDCIRQINLQTLKSITIGGKEYKIRG